MGFSLDKQKIGQWMLMITGVGFVLALVIFGAMRLWAAVVPIIR